MERWEDVPTLQRHSLSESHMGSGMAVICDLEVTILWERM